MHLLKYLWRGVVGLIGVVLVYLLAGTIGGLIPAKTTQIAQGQDHIVVLAPGLIHTDILLPSTPDTRAAFGFAVADGVPIENATWIGVGWGAAQFYTTVGTYSDLNLSAVGRAVVGDTAVLRIAGYGPIGEDHGWTQLQLSDEQMAVLINILAGEMTSQKAIETAGTIGRDAFYPARGRFNAFRTCNVWVGEVLRRIGVDVGIWTPFTWSLP